MLVYTLSDAIAVILLIILILIAVIALLVSRISTWFNRWWKKPSKNEPIDKTTEEYADLFRDSEGNPVDTETRCIIKNLANSGYSVEEIKEILEHKESQ